MRYIWQACAAIYAPSVTAGVASLEVRAPEPHEMADRIRIISKDFPWLVAEIGQNVVVSPDVVIGDNVKIQNNVSVYTGVILEDDVFCGPSMVFTNVLNPRSHVSRKHEFRDTLVRRGATIGANATVVCGHTLGRYAFVGAGAVVTRDVPDFALIVGNPGRLSGWMCRCGIKLPLTRDAQKDEATTCEACGTAYVKRGGVVSLAEGADAMD